jgi:hypothetical protein
MMRVKTKKINNYFIGIWGGENHWDAILMVSHITYYNKNNAPF